MEVSNFFTRLLQAPKEPVQSRQPDDVEDFDAAWQGIRETLEHPDERQIVRGITSTQVPSQLRHIVDALVYESNRTDEDTTGACLEYFLKNDILSQLERLCEADRPHGIKGEVLRSINNLVVLLSERFLVHNAVHRPLRRLLRSCVGDEPEEKVDGGARLMGAAGRSPALDRRASNDDIGEDLVDLMCILCSRMRAYPPLLLIFFHDKGWLQPHPSTSTTTETIHDRTMSPAPSAQTSRSDPSTSKPTHHFEFLLFSYLLRYVHREGRIGDFARAGLLFLFDIAFLTPNEEGGDTLQMAKEKDGSDPLQVARDALGTFILNGDFADVMAAGLGAVYSLLPSKLQVPSISAQAETEEENRASASGGMYLGAEGQMVDPDIRLSTDTEVRSQLDLLLKLFGFLQDIIYRCNPTATHLNQEDITPTTTHNLGSAISEATLDSIQASFLDNVLYPSILECSSHDGSAVAVLTYLNVIFSNLDDGPLLHRVLAFLLDTESTDEVLHAHTTNTKPKLRTGAMDYVHKPSYVADYFADEGRFTLKDLILDSLRADEWTASTAALQLLRTLLVEHNEYALKGLLTVVRDPAATALARKAIPVDVSSITIDTLLPKPVTSTDPQLQEIELYGSLISRLDPLQISTDLTAGYAGYLADMHVALQSDHSYRASQIPLSFSNGAEKDSPIQIGRYDADPFQHRLSPTDPMVRTILVSFSQFLSKTPDENVALTGVLTALALCPNRSLSGWLLHDVPKETNPWVTRKGRSSSSPNWEQSDSDDSDVDIDRHNEVDSHDPFTAKKSIDPPAIYQILLDLVKQISSFRVDIPYFDRLLSERRQGLLFADHLDEAMNVMLEVETTNSVFGNPVTPQQQLSKRPKARPSLASSIKSFLTPKRGVVTPTSTPSKDSSVVRSLFRSSTSTAVPAASREETSRGSEDASTEQGNVATSSSSTPFKSHYERTTISLDLAPASTSPILTGPWSPARIPRMEGTASRSRTPNARTSSALSTNLADELSSASVKRDLVEEGQQGTKTVSLSTILDNCVILEEFLKEIVAVITARRALGIDQVGYI
ncbi:hypothetical protein CI109_102889 [Kwoniella shandongensis]|uniref:Uncharacterized protein n=1 Tax=Kwoniella shandongensis TaxID=1734106 RepID=A0A5M6CDN5_9TREE|nr:uncharacterized protein CI109_000079 [Kwoniella shandongensis]KAA5531239.1 hypothetical protein CI109_000079 [Kwoniella shandongensis]